MDGATDKSICTRCGSVAEVGSIFCKTCGETLRPIAPLIHAVASEVSPQLPTWKRRFRGLVKTIAYLAGIIIVFDRGTEFRGSKFSGIVLIGAAALLLLCFLGWRFLDLGEDDIFWPKKAKS